uniref:AlNc14C26G2583 protein n=1 Tax=Albugo laibachii Nc14 TaxID=890382 RepID=F0W6U7_9STRA|nr:AlNc14C26G2583 [Albugo laibachii Nc14]|eukprot:CCA16842.1 AlNc14C26G2583 [Albugo laibachii Nc14]
MRRSGWLVAIIVCACPNTLSQTTAPNTSDEATSSSLIETANSAISDAATNIAGNISEALNGSSIDSTDSLDNFTDSLESQSSGESSQLYDQTSAMTGGSSSGKQESNANHFYGKLFGSVSIGAIAVMMSFVA